MGKREEKYKSALQNKKIPVLTLDHKWHRLFNTADTTTAILKLEEQLNELLKRQGKLNTESKEIRQLKKKLMGEMMPMADEYDKHPCVALEKKIETTRRLIGDCSEKLENYRDELMDLPKKIDEVNYDLMLATMDACYDKLSENTAEIEDIDKWITGVRIELKKKMIRKQEKEQFNQELYAYMHAVFGAEVIDIFDMKYNPDKQIKKNDAQQEGKKTE